MKKNNLNIEYVEFKRDGLEDFKRVILPDIYGDLFITEDFEERAVFAVGALADGVPVGAVVGQLTENGIADLKSVFVLPEYRLRGIGTELMKGVVTAAHDRIAETVNTDESYVLLGVRVGYVLSGRDLSDFEAWLKAVGFDEFTERPDVYLFEDKFPTVRAKRSAEVYPLSAIPDAAAEDVENLFRDMGIAPVASYSFYTGSAAEPEMMLLTVSPDTETFYLLSAGTGEGGLEDEYLSLVEKVFDEIALNQPDAPVFVDTAMNLYPELWKKIAKKAVVLKRKEARFYIKFA